MLDELKPPDELRNEPRPKSAHGHGKPRRLEDKKDALVVVRAIRVVVVARRAE